LSHPFIVDAAENHFVPVCVFNNTKGDDDARVLKSFKEPAWNNPVIRILDGQKKDLVDRIGNQWTVHALADAMIAALQKKKVEVLPYLTLLAAEEASRKRGVETAIFGMG
jgi:hypothetical protein